MFGIETMRAMFPVASVLQAFVNSNVSGKVIVVILIGASIVAWAVMVSKFKDLRLAQQASDRFVTSFRGSGHPLTLFIRKQEFPKSPLARVYEAGCEALGAEVGGRERPGSLFLDDDRIRRIELNSLQLEVIRRVTERMVADQALVLESGMGHLMIAVSASPMLGLLGTVWGVLDAFGAMAVKGMANLSAVAPGISGALLTTVVGLLVALPSSIGYNILAGRIRTLAVQMDNFSQEFVADIQRAFGRE